MEVKEWQYKRLVSFGNYDNEEFRVVVGVTPGEDADEVADAARVMIDAALKRSKRERDFDGLLDDVKSRIARLADDLRLSDEAYIQQFRGADVDQDWLDRQLQGRAEKRLKLAAYERMLADLERVGPEGDFESLRLELYLPGNSNNGIITLPFAEDEPVDDEEFGDDENDEEEVCPF